tara:strand:+ start:117 stop:524 length:408 start_codon:yes stop_codon:yes gene_type:complete
MVIGKISSLATTIFVFALGILFLKQAWGSSIGASGQDVGAGLTGTASGITNLIDAFISPIAGLINTFSSFFGGLGSNGSRDEPQPMGREDRQTPEQKVKPSDTSTITWSSGTSATVPTLSAEAKSYYRKLGVKVS